MTKPETAGNASALTPAQESTGIVRADLAETFAMALGTIPEAGQEGWEGILATIARAERPEDLDAPWRAAGGKAYIGRPLEVRSMRRMPSSYDEGLPFFLVLDAVDLLTGEVIAITTGSVGVVGPLAIANARGWVPIRGSIVESARPTDAGFYPQHWQMDRTGSGKPAPEPAAAAS